MNNQFNIKMGDEHGRPRPHNDIVADYAKAMADGILINGKPIEIFNGCYCTWHYNSFQKRYEYMPMISTELRNEATHNTDIGILIFNRDTQEATYIIDNSAATADNLEQIVADFKEYCNITISLEAIRHNFRAWSHDYKSNFVDEDNGVSVFSPCGHNPLKFYVGSINENDHTYEC